MMGREAREKGPGGREDEKFRVAAGRWREREAGPRWKYGQRPVGSHRTCKRLGWEVGALRGDRAVTPAERWPRPFGEPTQVPAAPPRPGALAASPRLPPLALRPVGRAEGTPAPRRARAVGLPLPGGLAPCTCGAGSPAREEREGTCLLPRPGPS